MNDLKKIIDNRFERILDFEKNLPKELKNVLINNISIWSLMRVELLSNQLTDTRFEKNKLTKEIEAQPLGPQGSLSLEVKEILKLIKFIFFRKKNSTLIRVCSFSLIPNEENEVFFKNANLQKIYEDERENVIILVNNVSGYKISLINDKVIILPSLILKLITLIGKIECSWISIKNIVELMTSSFALDKKHITHMLEYKLGAIVFFKTLYSLLNVKKIYFESPNGCFESEIVSTKICKIQSVEIYHGVIANLEPSYTYEHLEFGHSYFGLCEIFLAPSEKQKNLLSKMNPYYKHIDVIDYEITDALKFEYQTKSEAYNREKRPKTSLLLITSVNDGSIINAMGYLQRNLASLGFYEKIVIRMHPVDFEERWKEITSQFPNVIFSQDSLVEDILKSKKIVITCATTVSLQLSYLGIGFENCGEDIA